LICTVAVPKKPDGCWSLGASGLVSLLEDSSFDTFMILDILLSIVSFFLSGVAVVLPSFSIFPTNLASGLSGMVASINGWSWIFPVDTLFHVFAVLVVLVFAEFTYVTFMYVLRFVAN